MTDNPIAEVIDRAIDNCHACQEMHISAIAPLRNDILAALEAAGLTIVGRRPQKCQLEAMVFDNYSASEHANYCAAIDAFDPTTYTPEQSDTALGEDEGHG